MGRLLTIEVSEDSDEDAEELLRVARSGESVHVWIEHNEAGPSLTGVLVAAPGPLSPTWKRSGSYLDTEDL